MCGGGGNAKFSVEFYLTGIRITKWARLKEVNSLEKKPWMFLFSHDSFPNTNTLISIAMDGISIIIRYVLA